MSFPPVLVTFEKVTEEEIMFCKNSVNKIIESLLYFYKVLEIYLLLFLKKVPQKTWGIGFVTHVEHSFLN